MKKTIEMIKQNIYKKENKKNTKPEALITTKEKQTNQRRSNTENGKIRNQTENKDNREPTMQILQCIKLVPNTQVSSTRSKLQ